MNMTGFKNARMSPVCRRTKVGAFTLLEIMVVVAIIAILAALAMSIGTAVKNHALEDSTKATLLNLDMAMKEYLKSHPEPTDAKWFQNVEAEPASAKVMASVKGLDVNGQQVLDSFGSRIVYVPANTPITQMAIPPAAPPPPKILPYGIFKSFGRDLVDDSTVPGGGNHDDIFSNGTAQQ